MHILTVSPPLSRIRRIFQYIANGMKEIAPQPRSPVKKARDAVRSAAVPQQQLEDPLLENLIQLSDLGSNKPLVSRYYFTDAMLETVDDSAELKRVEQEILQRDEEAKQLAADNVVGESNDGKVAAAASVTEKPSSSSSEKKQPSAADSAPKGKSQALATKKSPVASISKKPVPSSSAQEKGSLATKQPVPKKAPAASLPSMQGSAPTGAPARARKDGSPVPKKSRSPARKPALDDLSSQTAAKLPKEPAVVDLVNDVEDQRRSPDENRPQNSLKPSETKPCITNGSGRADDAIDLCLSDDSE